MEEPKPEVFTCIDCGHTSTNREDFIAVNWEEPSFSMADPYPGYRGDLICKDGCQ